ncbi:hypothetical protein IJJ05_01210 [Candidatus Saccharibacteria bacterium]|nr:hypothetical protein [Candidatus Saccharibacteria bacterium]
MQVTFEKKIENDFPEFRFKKGKKFAFHPPKTIILGPNEPFDELLTLHEISHAILGHKDFKTGVGRLKMEAEAWEKAKELAALYGVEIDDDFIQWELDTYRDWLHKKSRCPKCGLTRFQTQDGDYHCPRCENLV